MSDLDANPIIQPHFPDSERQGISVPVNLGQEELVVTQPAEVPTSRLATIRQAAKNIVLSGVVAAEMLPVTNEGTRFGALFATETVTHNPLAGALVLGGTTALVEGAGALAAAELLTGNTSNKVINWVNRIMERYVAYDSKMHRPTEASIAMTLGTPILMAARQRQDPETAKDEARRRGLITVAWLTGVFAVEGAAISAGMSRAGGLPEKIAAGVLIAEGLSLMPRWIKKIATNETREDLTNQFDEVKTMIPGGILKTNKAGRSAALYESFRNKSDEAVKIGLYGDDLKAAYNNPHALLIKYEKRGGKNAYAPLLVPAQSLEWYNMDLLKRTYGYGKDFYYYARPPMPRDEASLEKIVKVLKEKLDQGAIIFTDEYIGSEEQLLKGMVSTDDSYTLEYLGGGDIQRTGEVFVAPAKFYDVDEIKEGPSLYEVYKQSIDAGEFIDDPINGVSLASIIEGEEAEEIWQVYRNPFEKLGEEHPMNAGFDRETLLGILADPDVAKIVNRQDGRITTLCFFVNDFDHCPWFNKQYYQERYPEYYQTNNILIFPGIVSDDRVKGNAYSLPVIGLAAKLMRKRDTNVLVTFECTETSASYIPTIVTYAINHSGVAEVEKIGAPISRTAYIALKKN